MAGVELTLLDCARNFHKAAGINSVAQIAKDIGANPKPDRLLAKAAAINRLMLKQPLRHSEDIDLVQTQAEPIGTTVVACRQGKAFFVPFR